VDNLEIVCGVCGVEDECDVEGYKKNSFVSWEVEVLKCFTTMDTRGLIREN